MWHYRLTFQSNGQRLFIATLTAVAFHFGLLQVEFASGPVTLPEVSLPQSVSIMLRRVNPAQSVISNEKKEIKEVRAGREVPSKFDELKLPEIQKSPAKPQETVRSIPSPAFKRKNVLQPIETFRAEGGRSLEEKPAAPPVQTQDGARMNPPAAEGPAKSAKVEPATVPGSGKAGEGTAKPGALQTAYPRYQFNIPPAYPGLARKRGWQGTVMLQVLVNREGRVDKLTVDVSSGFPMLDRAALAAVSKWLFEPGRRGRDPVTMWVRVPVTFKLKN